MQIAIPRPVVRRSIMLLVAVAMLALTLISLAGMSASMLVVESARGSASVINIAGSLRRYTQRVANLIAVDALSGSFETARVAAAVEDFETQLEHPALLRFVERAPGELFAATYRGVSASWYQSLKPRIEALDRQSAPAAEVELLLSEVDAFVEQLNSLVAVLEHDTEARIHDLRFILGVAIAVTVLVVSIALFMLYRAVLRPLRGLLEAARRIAGGDFGVRVDYTGDDEFGRVGRAFNLMADELAKYYHSLEQRVADKTAELQRSNRSLELLYHAIARLYQSPTAVDAYEATLRDIDRRGCAVHRGRCGVDGGVAHAQPGLLLGEGATDRSARGEEACQACREASHGHGVALHNPALLRFPLRDREHHYGMLRLALPDGVRLEDWQRQLVEALSRHMGMALGAARRTEQERLLALQEERSVIARELHDSIAQSLSYLKIQVTRLEKNLDKPADARAIAGELKHGLNSAYRELRELLTTFRLRIDERGFNVALEETIAEFSEKIGSQVALHNALPAIALSANEEMHVIRIIREALSNIERHAHASEAMVEIAIDDERRVKICIHDNGGGFDPQAIPENHFGTAIMQDRAQILGGDFSVDSAPCQGTRISLSFVPQHYRQAEPETAQ